jgi:hypothetical protein
VLPKPVRPATVEARLAEEAARFNGIYRGFHEYKPIWPVEDDPCNWSTSCAVRGSPDQLERNARSAGARAGGVSEGEVSVRLGETEAAADEMARFLAEIDFGE